MFDVSHLLQCQLKLRAEGDVELLVMSMPADMALLLPISMAADMAYTRRWTTPPPIGWTTPKQALLMALLAIATVYTLPDDCEWMKSL